MTLEELEKKLFDLDDLRMELNKHIAELKEQREEPKPPHPRWKPKEGESFYAIGTYGSIKEYTSGINSDSFNCCNNAANVYPSADDVLFAIERRRVIAEMQEWAGHNYDGAYIYYHRPSDEIMIGWNGDSTYCFGSIHFKCVDDAENCVKAVGKDRIKKYYFMIPDEVNNG